MRTFRPADVFLERTVPAVDDLENFQGIPVSPRCSPAWLPWVAEEGALRGRERLGFPSLVVKPVVRNACMSDADPQRTRMTLRENCKAAASPKEAYATQAGLDP